MKHFTRVVVFAAAGLSLALGVRAETGVHRIVATAAEKTGVWAEAAVAGDDAYGTFTSVLSCAGVAEKDRGHILGGQGNNWTEYTWNAYDLEWR